MANVNIKFNNKDYLLSCEDGQEENLKELADYLDSKYSELQKSLGNIGESKLMLITAIKMVDEYFDLNKKVDSKKNEFEKLSIKFKELRSLAINYKDEKEKEIGKLKKDLGNIGENKLLLITAIKMVDDYFDLFKKVKNKKNDFEKLSIKFKELRSLAISYKGEKEIEIGKLKDELNKFKTMAEQSKNSYEEILDKTTRSIEKFIESAENNREKNIQ